MTNPPLPDSGRSGAVAGPALPALTPDQKAAIVVYSLGPARAEQLLRRMDERDHRRFAQAMNGLGMVGADVVDAVTAEFATAIDGGNGIRGGIGEVRKFLAGFMDAAAVERLIEDIDGPTGRDIWEKLSNTPAQTLFAYLGNEQPQSVAVILSHLAPEKAARVLEMFSEERAKAIILRMARLGEIDGRVMADLKATLQADFLAGFRKRQGARQPHALLTGLLNQMSQRRAEAMLEMFRAEDRDLAEKVQKMLFTFSDFPTRVGSTGLQTVIKNTDRDTLILALALAKTNAPEVMEYFFANMSKRVAEQMREEMEGAGPVRIKDAEAAQQEITRIAQDLSKSGGIEISDGEAEEGAYL